MGRKAGWRGVCMGSMQRVCGALLLVLPALGTGVLAQGTDRVGGAQDLDAFVQFMAAYKAPRLVEFVDALPKSGAGKVMWRLLQDKENAAPPAQS